jgi:uncharacterized phage-like protein YoqJ
MEKPFEEFGSLVFSEREMADRLPKPIYQSWKKTVANEGTLDRPTADAIAHAMKRWAMEKGVTHFISGMALGVDQICAEVVLELKARHPEITLECAFPCETQAVRWSESQRERYYRIAEQCDKETMLQHHYDKDCMQKRNRYMVDSSDIIIAVWNGKPSGTGNTVRYAQEQEKTVIVIDPQTLETKII